MSDITWPEYLPQKVEKDGYSETPPDSRIRTPMDMGPAKVRRRFSAQVRPLSIVMNMTEEQLADFDTFFATTTESGSLPFDFPNPRGTGVLTVRFGEKSPQYGDFNGNSCAVSFDLEVLP